METEIWKDIPGYEGLYRICNIGDKVDGYGVIQRGRKTRTGKVNTPYRTIGLSKNGKRKNHLLHRLKAITFIPNPDNKPEVNHIDGNKLNNELDNLEWCTRGENARHASRIGLFKNLLFVTNNPMKGKFGGDCQFSKPVTQYSLSGELIKEWNSIVDVQRVLGIKHGDISAVCMRKKHHKTAGGFIWRYKGDTEI